MSRRGFSGCFSKLVVMFKVVLYEPEIPPNTGNIIRLCANMGAELHLIQPLGFELDDRKLKRAGLDYHEWASVQQHPNYAAFVQTIQAENICAFTTHGTHCYADHEYSSDDILMFGPETRGLPKKVLETIPGNRTLRIPMQAHSRSLNLSNTVAIAVYEAWRQLGFQSPSD